MLHLSLALAVSALFSSAVQAEVNCKTIKTNAACAATAGCRFYPEPQWWISPRYEADATGDFKAPKIGCDSDTMCARLTISPWCNKYDHCTWVDGACRPAGTQPDPDWKPQCNMYGQYREQYCWDLGPQCKYVLFNVCNSQGKRCETVDYGCRGAAFCAVNKGSYLQTQCASLGDTCMWDSSTGCLTAPTASPTLRPTQSPTRTPSKAPTYRPSKSPTYGPTKSPTFAPTQKPTTLAPTSRPTTARPTTLAPTNQPTPPTTLAPTRAPTTPAPTKFKCPVTSIKGTLRCDAHPFGELDQTFAVPPGTEDKEFYCTELCAAGGAPGSYNTPLFPGCRAWTFDGTSCRLFGCYPGGAGALAGTVLSRNVISYGVLGANCYSSGQLPTQSPTSTCLYSNVNNPPTRVADSKPIADSCKIYTADISNDFTGDNRARLDWCQEGCTNTFKADGCTAVELYGATAGGAAAKCIYAKCTTLANSAIARNVYRSTKTNTC